MDKVDSSSIERAAWAECGAVGHLVDDLMKGGGYSAILDDPSKHEPWQDVLDSVLQSRLFAVRNALRNLGYMGEQYKSLAVMVGDTAVVLQHDHARVGAGRNIISTTFELVDPASKRVLHSVVDRVNSSASDFAKALHAGALQSLGVEQLDRAEAAARIHELLQQARGVWASLPKDVRDEFTDANFPGTPLPELIDKGVSAAQEVVDHVASHSARPN